MNNKLHYKYKVTVRAEVETENGDILCTVDGGNFYINERLKSQGWDNTVFKDGITKKTDIDRRSLLANITDRIMRSLSENIIEDNIWSNSKEKEEDHTGEVWEWYQKGWHTLMSDDGHWVKQKYCEKCKQPAKNNQLYSISGGVMVCANCNKKTPFQDRTTDILDD